MIKRIDINSELAGYSKDNTVLTAEKKRINPILDSIARGLFFNSIYSKKGILPLSKAPLILDDIQWDREVIPFLLNNTILIDQIPGIFSYRLNYIQDENGSLLVVFLGFYCHKYFLLMYYLSRS